MTILWQVLGYDQVAHGISRRFSESAGIALLEGPPGVGKSWLARGIGASWQEGGGSTVVVEGDNARSDLPFYPFGLAMAGLPSGWRAMAPSAAGVAKVAETLLGTAGIFTSTIQGLLNIRNSRRRHRAMFLGDREQQILYELERFGGKRPILLIADNLHWWDRSSLTLLRELQGAALCGAFPFLEDVRVLAVQTTAPYQSVKHPEVHQKLLSAVSTRRFELERIQRRNFEQVLVALGADPEPSSEVTDVIYTFSGGHLALAGRAASRLAAGQGESFLAAARSDDFLKALVTERILALGELGRKAVELLQVAALLGLTFRRDEVVCASGMETQETSRLLRYCREERILELSDRSCTFVHDLYRQFFLSAGDWDRIEVHERLSECLRLLRPAEYDLRSMNALRADRPTEAASLGVQAALQRIREGRTWEDLPEQVVDAMRERNLDDVVGQFESALDHLKQYRHRDCLAALDRLPRDLPKAVLAESDYIRAMCRMSTRSESDRTLGRSILAAWSGYENEEPELGIRLSRLLLYGLSHLLDKEPGRILEGRIRQVLVNRVAFDPSAKDDLYTMDRCSGSLYQPDIALVRNSEAAAHFGPTPDHMVIRRPIEHYRCLVNLGANLIANARYEEAQDVYEDVERLLNEYPAGVFPRVDYPRTNALLARFRLGVVEISEAVETQREIVSGLGLERDPFYAGNALAVYLTFSEFHSDAIEIFDNLEAELMKRDGQPEPSMVYLIRSNRCASRFVSGDVSPCREEWRALAATVKQIAYVFQPILARRHELLAKVFADGRPMSPKEFDDYLILNYQEEFGPLWDNFGRGFRMPEVEFWREN